VESQEGSEERKSADVIDLTELLKRSLAGKPAAKKPAAKKSTKKAS
jgi:DNA end-binding protein Ku